MEPELETLRDDLIRGYEGIVAIAVFGSYVTSEEYEDIDLLVVADNLPKRRLDRVKNIVSLKRRIRSRRPVDITLVPRDECIENFRGHNPLYLDIALDGKIIYDSEGFLTDLITETRSEIKSRCIKRVGTSWRFPVKYREPTPLSPVNNNDWGVTWLEEAKQDLITAEASLEKNVFASCVYHSQQVIEKVIKSILICFGTFEKTHFVSSILDEELKTQKLSQEWIEQLGELVEIANELEPHESLSRYPGMVDNKIWVPSKKYDEEKAKKSLEKARSAIKIGEDFVTWWFRKEGEAEP